MCKGISTLIASLAILSFLPACQDDAKNKTPETGAETAPVSLNANADGEKHSADATQNAGDMKISSQSCQTFRDCKDGGLCISASIDDKDSQVCAYMNGDGESQGADLTTCSMVASITAYGAVIWRTVCTVTASPTPTPPRYLPVNPVSSTGGGSSGGSNSSSSSTTGGARPPVMAPAPAIPPRAPAPPAPQPVRPTSRMVCIGAGNCMILY